MVLLHRKILFYRFMRMLGKSKTRIRQTFPTLKCKYTTFSEIKPHFVNNIDKERSFLLKPSFILKCGLEIKTD